MAHLVLRIFPISLIPFFSNTPLVLSVFICLHFGPFEVNLNHFRAQQVTLGKNILTLRVETLYM